MRGLRGGGDQAEQHALPPRGRGLLRRLHLLVDVGLGYVPLEQQATTLSDGEAQRVKLTTEIVRRPTGRTLYLLDEPITGLHAEDVARLLGILDAIVPRGNTVLLVEHNLDVLKRCD